MQQNDRANPDHKGHFNCQFRREIDTFRRRHVMAKHSRRLDTLLSDNPKPLTWPISTRVCVAHNCILSHTANEVIDAEGESRSCAAVIHLEEASFERFLYYDCEFLVSGSPNRVPTVVGLVRMRCQCRNDGNNGRC